MLFINPKLHDLLLQVFYHHWWPAQVALGIGTQVVPQQPRINAHCPAIPSRISGYNRDELELGKFLRVLLKLLLEEKEIGRSKIYALTSKGKKAVREIAQHHQKMLESMEQNIRMMQSVIGKEDTFPLEILRRIQQGQAPFASLTGDLIKLRDTLFEASQKELTQRQRKELSAIISSTIRKVKAVCNQS